MEILTNTMAKAYDEAGRISEVISDPINSRIKRDKDAGKVEDGKITMHNGIQIYSKSYGDLVERILVENRGVHEPQEEYVFDLILDRMQDGATMIELGSFWAFYSLWFNFKVSGAKNYMIEPDPEYLKAGEANFKLNEKTGKFFNYKIGSKTSGDTITVDDFMSLNDIHSLDILHCDIQGYELEMLKGAEKALAERRIDYLFISTHSNKLHYDCLDFLNEKGYKIISTADFENESYCFDGIIVATRFTDFSPIDIGKRETIG